MIYNVGMKAYDVFQCDRKPSEYAMYKDWAHETIKAETAQKSRKIYLVKHPEATLIAAQYLYMINY